MNLVAKWIDLAKRCSSPDRFDEETEAPEYDEELRDLQDTTEWEKIAPVVYAEATRLLREAHLVAPEDGSEFLHLQRTLHSAMIEIARRRVMRRFPNAHIALDPVFQEIERKPVVNPVAKISLANLITDYQKDPTRPALRGKTLAKRQAQWRMLESFFGATTAIGEIERSDVRRFMSFLERFPSNASKHFPGVEPTTVVALPEAQKLPAISPDTANDYLRQLGALTRFALHEGLIKTDPAAGLLFAKPKIAAKDKRLPFSEDDLKRIFGAPLFRGCVDDEAGYSKPGPNIIRRGRFWVPLIALFTGMRLNEICQLTLDDFVVEDGTDIILIRGSDDETKRVKTEAGQRFVLVHPEPKAIGLLAHIDGLRRKRASNAPVFADLAVGTTGYRSDPFSKFFARFLDHVGITHSKKVFHSFRHTYRDALREAEISPERVRALAGWTSGRTEEAYGSGLRPSTLRTEIERISYPDLDLSHLKANRS
ncbi:Phage integrase family protein [Fulvimarina manganoxydans]|uniref:Phage integrase family protein n=1 Tax=Fulvimarina manganoxydans TaxID=937218 RepID=A0A1W2DEE5_9HYPH|nr:tyrosine-type recombinase/integrase [Fulvimarina manganoxydans]SMC95909.1 Phage integrase family protein [Fulvimarina manganoxydans]